jgi:pyruvate dehydrogenase phosphatase
MNAQPGFRIATRVEDFLGRNLTPPYLSNRADVQKADLGAADAFLILCSDGLMDLYEHETLDQMANTWVQLVGGIKARGERQNAALCLLREGLGGKDDEKVSRVLTVELMEKWMDDTTVIVLSL